jgi:hypothetical protein
LVISSALIADTQNAARSAVNNPAKQAIGARTGCRRIRMGGVYRIKAMPRRTMSLVNGSATMVYPPARSEAEIARLATGPFPAMDDFPGIRFLRPDCNHGRRTMIYVGMLANQQNRFKVQQTTTTSDQQMLITYMNVL